MSKRFHKVVDRFTKGARPSSAIGRWRSRDARATTTFTGKPTFVLQLRVRASHGIRRHTEIAGELTDCRKRVAGPQLAAFDETAQLVDDLLEWGRVEIGIDR